MYFHFVVLSLCIIVLIQRSSLESFNLAEHVRSKMSDKEADPSHGRGKDYQTQKRKEKQEDCID